MVFNKDSLLQSKNSQFDKVSFRFSLAIPEIAKTRTPNLPFYLFEQFVTGLPESSSAFVD